MEGLAMAAIEMINTNLGVEIKISIKRETRLSTGIETDSLKKGKFERSFPRRLKRKIMEIKISNVVLVLLLVFW